jgi:transposase
MPHYVGLDVSQKTTAICVVDAQGKRLWRGVCATDPGPISARISQHAGVGDRREIGGAGPRGYFPAR